MNDADILARLEILERTIAGLELVPGQTTDFTPTLYQNGASIGITIDFANYCVLGPLVFMVARFTTTGAGAVGLVEVRSIPYTSRDRFIGGDFLVFTGGVNYDGSSVGDPGGDRILGAITGSAGNFGSSPAVALASGATFRVSAWYARS